jgi:hypothetical protein
VAPHITVNTTEFVGVSADRHAEVKLPQAGPDGVIRDWTPRVTVFTERRRTHAEAVERLREIAFEAAATATVTEIGGWPAIERRELKSLPRRGRTVEEIPTSGMALVTTTAIAAGVDVIRVEGYFPPGAADLLIEDAVALGRSFETARATPDSAETQRGLARLREERKPELSLFRSAAGAGAGRVATTSALPGAALQVFAGSNGEFEIAASEDGQDVVIARQRHSVTSNNGGQTFRAPIPLPFSNRGDPSITVGESGAFYWAAINNTAGCGGSPLYGCATGVMASTDRGQTFPFVANAVQCPTAGGGACFPDQHHIAADRWNAAAGGDQVYSVWRNFTVGETPTIVCSQDNGVNWTAPAAIDAGYVPRVSVGADGFVYAVYGQGGNIRVNKYSSCDTGLVQQAGFPVTATAFTGVTCPVPGLDRCNNGNILASFTIAVDEGTPARMLLVYADDNLGGGESIYARRSTDGGATWGAATVINGGAANVKRFMPWVSISDGIAHVTWYDRRAVAGGGTNDQTDFFRNTVNIATMAVGTEVALQVNQDPHCASGWPCGTRAEADSEQCTNQPQLAGACLDAGGNQDGADPTCDFSLDDCNPGFTCSTGGGCPKYGDYNGNATAGGWVYSVWASATAPPATANSGAIDLYFEAAQIGTDPDLTINKVDSVDPVNPGQSVGYVVTVTNNDDTLAVGITVSDTLTNAFQAISAAGWSCTTPTVGNPGLVTCDLASLPGGASAQFTVSVVAPNIIGSITNSATVAGDNDANAGNNGSPVVSTQVLSPADVDSTKVLSSPWGVGNLYPGAPLTYTIVLTNVSPYDQFDNPTDEFTDVIPPQLTITGTSATSGTISTVGNTVSWNGVVPGNGSVTLQVDCQINQGAEGATISNQGIVHCDADGNGTNESDRASDDPSVGGPDNATEFDVKVPIPTLGQAGFAAFLLLVAGIGLWLLRRHATA